MQTLRSMFEKTMPEQPGATIVRELLREQFYLGALAAVTMAHSDRDELLEELASWLAAHPRIVETIGHA